MALYPPFRALGQRRTQLWASEGTHTSFWGVKAKPCLGMVNDGFPVNCDVNRPRARARAGLWGLEIRPLGNFGALTTQKGSIFGF